MRVLFGFQEPEEILRRISLTFSHRMSGERRTYSRTRWKDA
jgi:hypothetical protein